MQTSNTLPLGTILNSGIREYEILSVLGQGGFGITYLAKSDVLVGNIPVEAFFAIKEHYISKMNERVGVSVVISNENNRDEINESIDSFITEAKRLNKLSLNHPGIVRVNENFKANDTAYYVMEYIKGSSVRKHIRQTKTKKLSEKDALLLFRPIAETIGYLHKNKVTHLDIKPDNILIRENGKPVIIDFGLSKHYNSKGSPTSTIKTLGCSDGYSPMEQYAGITTFTPEADIYALAATLLYMLTGKDPIKSTEISPSNICNSLPNDISVNTKSVILKSMEKLKENRISRVEDFLKCLYSVESSQKTYKNDKEEEGNSHFPHQEESFSKKENSNRTKKFGKQEENRNLIQSIKRWCRSLSGPQDNSKVYHSNDGSTHNKKRCLFVTIILYGIQLFSAFCFFFMLNELRLWPDEMLSDSVWLIKHAGMPQFALLPIVVFICNWMVIKWKRSGLYLLISLVSLIVYPLILLGFNNYFLPSTAMSFSALATYWALLLISFNGKSTWSLMKPLTSLWVRELFVITIILWFPIALCGSAEYPEQAVYVVGIPLFLILLSVHLFIEWIRNRNKAKNSDSVQNESVKNRFVDVQGGNVKLYVKIAVIALLLTSLATLVHFIEMATDSDGISGSENETVWVYVWIWTLSAFVLIFRKKLPSLITFAINFIKEYKQSKLNHHE